MARRGAALISTVVIALASAAALGGQLAAHASPVSAVPRPVVAAATGPGVAAATGPGAAAATGPGAVPAAAVPLPPRFTEQQLEWGACAGYADIGQIGQIMDTVGAECATVTVPLDYARIEGPTLKIAISRLKAKDEANRRGALLLNPGGPGASGLSMPVLLAQYTPAVAARYDLIGMDPRFVGSSSALDCKWSASSSLRGAGPDKRSFARHVAYVRKLANECADLKAVLPHASTRNTARDIDLVRVLLGEQQLSYLGYSYGTYLGSVYLQMFPAHVDRVVLDSAIDPTAFGPGVFSRNAPAMNAALNAWAAWTARRNSVYRLGSSTKQVLANVELIRKTADRRSLVVGEYRIDSGLIPLLMWVSEDDPDSYAEQAAAVSVLRDAARGAPVDPTVALADTLDFIASNDGSPTASVNTAVLCADRAVSRTTSTYFSDIEKHRKSERLFGPLTRNITPCAFWPARPAENPTRISSTVPALIINATGDTQTPYTGAKVLHKLLSKSRLVTLRNAYRHAVYLTGRSTCVDRTVEKYLVDGVLPRSDVTCTTDRSSSAPSGLSVADGLRPASPLPPLPPLVTPGTPWAAAAGNPTS